MKEKILVIAAHPDDEILGCGGTIAKKIYFEKAEVNTLILSRGIASRENIIDLRLEIKKNSNNAVRANKLLGVKKTEMLNFPDNEFDKVSHLNIVKEIEKKIVNYKPDTIYTHFSGDLNLDHQITNRAVLIATRPSGVFFVKKIYAFEICSSTDWSFNFNNNQFTPNHFEDISKTIRKKIEALKCYSSEMRKYPHSRSYLNIKNLAKLRGATVYTEFAESFVILRSIA